MFPVHELRGAQVSSNQIDNYDWFGSAFPSSPVLTEITWQRKRKEKQVSWCWCCCAPEPCSVMFCSALSAAIHMYLKWHQPIGCPTWNSDKMILSLEMYTFPSFHYCVCCAQRSWEFRYNFRIPKVQLFGLNNVKVLTCSNILPPNGKVPVASQKKKKSN